MLTCLSLNKILQFNVLFEKTMIYRTCEFSKFFLHAPLLLFNVEFKIVKVLKYFVKYRSIFAMMLIDQAK